MPVRLSKCPGTRNLVAGRQGQFSWAPCVRAIAAAALVQKQPGLEGAPQRELQEAASGGASSSQPLITFDEVAEAATRRGLHLSLEEFGLLYRIICREENETGKVLGMTNGFVAPLFGLMHCDTLQVFTRGLSGDVGQRVRGGPLGLGLLLGGATFSYGHSRGCSKAEILAINDDDSWHERLIRYYSYFGFKPVCKVGGNGLSDLPHMLVWGGEGMRMDADIQHMLRRWTPALRRTASRREAHGVHGDAGA